MIFILFIFLFYIFKMKYSSKTDSINRTNGLVALLSRISLKLHASTNFIKVLIHFQDQHFF